MRRFDVAQHEAAHMVVGIAVGLRITRVELGDTPLHGDWRQYGAVWFYDRTATATQLSLAIAAGCAWDRGMGEESEGDYRLLRTMRQTRREIDALVLAASAIMAGRLAIHQRCARALYERDLTAADIPRLVEGERLHD
jgi:hypothetical protein